MRILPTTWWTVKCCAGPAAHRGAGPGGRAGQCGAPPRARLLRAAPAPEGGSADCSHTWGFRGSGSKPCTWKMPGGAAGLLHASWAGGGCVHGTRPTLLPPRWAVPDGCLLGRCRRSRLQSVTALGGGSAVRRGHRLIRWWRWRPRTGWTRTCAQPCTAMPSASASARRRHSPTL